MGRRFDFLITENHPKSDLNCNKMIIERNGKLPRVLKDMLDMLVQEKRGDASNSRTFGVAHSAKVRNCSIYCL